MFVALIIPILMNHFKIDNVPTAVAEIAVGIFLGKSVLNVVNETNLLNMMSTLGVMMLMFLSGMEINFDLFKPRDKKKTAQSSTLGLALQSYGIVVCCAVVLGGILYLLGLFQGLFLAVLLFSTIALGVVIPTLKEKGILNKNSGQALMLTAVLGEVIPMLALTVYASINGGNAGRLWLIVFLFVAAILLLWRFKQPYILFNKISKSTTQLDVRLAFFLIFTLVSIAEDVGAESILGAFLAGIVMKLLEPADATEEKLNSIGYGFLIPFFFIMTGVKLDLKGLFADPKGLLLIPVFVGCFFLAKLPTLLIFRRLFSKQNSLASSFLMTTTITLVLPALEVAKSLHTINTVQSDAFILAAVIICIIGPVGFNSIYKLEKSDLIKQRVVMLGSNLATIPVAQQLTKEWYDVQVVTDNEENYKAFQGKVKNLHYIPEIDENKLKEQGLFDTDIFLSIFDNDARNAELAKIAKTNNVKRVIAAQDSLTLMENNKIISDDIEVFNPYIVNISVLRALIETPAISAMFKSTEAGLYTVTLANPKYDNYLLRALPFSDKVTISSIYHNNQKIVANGDTRIKLGDRLVYISDYHQATEVKKEFGAH